MTTEMNAKTQESPNETDSTQEIKACATPSPECEIIEDELKDVAGGSRRRDEQNISTVSIDNSKF